MSFRRTEVYTCDWCGDKYDADHGSLDCYYTGDPLPTTIVRFNGGHLCTYCNSRRTKALEEAETAVRAACESKR